MRRALSTRIFSALVASWLAFVLAEPAALHICPEHDAVPAAASDAAAHGAHGASGHASHAAAEHGVLPHEAGDVPAPHQCACVGHCAGSSAAGVPTVVSAGTAAILLARDDAPGADFAFTAPAPAFLLPFANGPPLPT